MTNNQLLAYTKIVVTDLISQGQIVAQEGSEWRLRANTPTLRTGTAFRTRDEAVERVSQAFVETYAHHADVRAA